MKKTLSGGLSFLLMTLLLPAVPSHTAMAQEGEVDFSRFVGVGDSLTAGFQSGSLFDDESDPEAVNGGQRHSFYVLLANAMETPYVLPLISYPGAGTLIVRTGEGCNIGDFAPLPPGTPARLNPQDPATNVAVPGQSIVEANAVTWTLPLGGDTPLEDLILGLPDALAGAPPSTQVDTAIRRQPTFLSVWLGSNDALAAALAADPAQLTPREEFEANANEAFEKLAATGARGVMANIPDVTVIAHLVSQAEIKALSGGALDDAAIRLLLGVKPTDFVPLTALPTVLAILTGQQQGPLAAGQILTKKEVKQIRKMTKRYNRVLAGIAAENDWAFVDVNAILNDINRNGLTVPGLAAPLTTNFFGGIFSLDGVHPTNTGHAVVAARFVEAINAKYGTSLAAPDVAAIAAADPNVCAAAGKRGLTLEDVERLGPVWESTARLFLADHAGR
jgi:lysophospholipase L1-like esterase